MYKSQGGRTAYKLQYQRTKNGKSRQVRCPSVNHPGRRFKLCGCNNHRCGPCTYTSMKVYGSVLETIAEEEGEYDQWYGDWENGNEYNFDEVCVPVDGGEYEEDEAVSVKEEEGEANGDKAVIGAEDAGAGAGSGADDLVVSYDVKTCEFEMGAVEDGTAKWIWDEWYCMWTHPTQSSFEVAVAGEAEADGTEFEFECDTVTSFSLCGGESQADVDVQSFATEQSFVLPSLAMSRTTSLNTSFMALEVDDGYEGAGGMEKETEKEVEDV